MISRSGREGLFKAHWDWLVAIVGVVALVAGTVGFFLAGDDGAAGASAAFTASARSGGSEQKPMDLEEYVRVARQIRTPGMIPGVPLRQANFLASERRVFCSCGRAIPGDIKAFPACPFCGEKQEAEKPVVVDVDGDGLPNEWEVKYGFNPKDAADAQLDKDGDGFTNLEEFQAKTDPTDRKSHPPYLDFVKVQLPLKQTFLPFFFIDVQRRPAGEFYIFRDPLRRNDYGQRGVNLSAKKGERIADTGFVVVGYEKKERKVAIRGGQGMMRTEDASEVTIRREKDGLVRTLPIKTDRAGVVKTPLEVEAKLTYEHGETKEFTVVEGKTIEINGEKFSILTVKPEGKGALVEIEDLTRHQKRQLKAIEP